MTAAKKESAQPLRTIHATASEREKGLRLDRFLAERLPELSRSRLKQLITSGQLALGERTITDPNTRVKPGQAFRLTLPAVTPATPLGEAIPLAIAHEDADLLVIDKPAGLVVHPAPGNPDRTLVNALIAHCGESLSGIGGVARPGIVHRLDKDTSGLLVVAKNDFTHRALTEQLRARTLKRVYLALVWGVPAPACGTIRAAIHRHPKHRKKMATVTRGGREAITHYRVVRRFGKLASLVECRLATGRTHQIRVHLAHLGHPLLGDPLYGRKPPAGLPVGPAAVLRTFHRQALHAHVIGFEHPRSGKLLEFTSDLPIAFAQLISSLDVL